ncbi:MAG: SPOR domain-containing protein [Pseudomonadota bacterium]
MATDYKSYVRRPVHQKHSRQQRRQKRRNAPLPGWLLFAGGLLLGAMAMGWMKLQQGEANSPVEQASAVDVKLQQQGEAAQQSVEEKKQQQAQQPEVEQHRFDFYTVLPGREVEVQPDSLRPAASGPAAAAEKPEAPLASAQDKLEKPPEKAPETAAANRYQMQLASFRVRADAERMMSSAALKGITSRIEKVTINDKAYYRVRSGPYSREQAYSLHKRLKKSGIESLIMRIK